MISKSTIDRIMDTARVEDVVGEFVNLKKRGVNLLGLCPFHNEKTPSFNVNPARNIYKCFGCGKAGNAVTFLMEHEHYTYPDALRALAKKYNIEIEEEQQTPEQAAIRDEKESMLLVNAFAQKYFSDTLFDRPEGKSIGLPYFKERGFSEAIIKKFQLGYSLDEWNAFTEAAIKNGYSLEFLEKTGLTIRKDDGKTFDRFKGRVMFPVHNLGGRVIAFGGRILKKDEKAAKYLNSPESEVYHKSKVLYGIYFAKNAIVQHDNCYLVEGYTDVISLHQSGVENVVASSGTALTTDQIRLIARYTKNVTVLYDADPAGIKASLRGIDMILEEGMNVKVVLFPPGEDPDSFARNHSTSEVQAFLKANAKDFIVFKTNLLIKEVEGDPVKKAMLIRDVVDSIAKIPDPIIRSTYAKQCSALLDIQEQIIIAELNKIRRTQLKKSVDKEETEEIPLDLLPVHQPTADEDAEHQERDIVRLLLNYANHDLHFIEEVQDEDGRPEIKQTTVKVAQFIINELENDGIVIENPVFQKLFSELFSLAQGQESLDQQSLMHHPDNDIANLAISLITSPHILSENWEAMHRISVPSEEEVLKQAVIRSIHAIKIRSVMKLLKENREKIKQEYTAGNDIDSLLQMQQQLERVKMELSKELGIDVLK